MSKKFSFLRVSSEISVIAVGFFLLLDTLILNSALRFDYSKLGLQTFDPFISHAYIGIILIAIGMVDLSWSIKDNKL